VFLFFLIHQAMQDRFSDLKTGNVQGEIRLDMVADDPDTEENAAFMPEFFNEVGQVKASMSLIRKNLKALQDTFDRQLNSVAAPNSQQMDELMEATNASVTQIRNALKKVKDETDRLDASSPQKRIRANMHSVLLKKFLALLTDYQSLQTQIRDKTKERLVRQAAIARPGVTQEEVEEMLDAGGDVFADKLMSEAKHTEAKNALKNIQEQQRELHSLEQNIQELHQLFLEMGTAVDLATEQVVKMEEHVSESALHTTAAVHAVARAKAYDQQRRRKIAIVVTSVLTVLLVAAIVVATLMATKTIAT
jgi:t-SNARE complex subunit (syntaxin)